MDTILEEIAREIAACETAFIGWSGGGKDSSLLIWLVRQVKPDIPVVWFRHDYRNRQPYTWSYDRVVAQNLHVVDFLPNDYSVISDGNDVDLIGWYPAGQQRAIPVVFGMRQDEKAECLWDITGRVSGELSQFPPCVIFSGAKNSDNDEWAGQRKCPDAGERIGDLKLFYPLRHLTDTDVWQAIEANNIPYNQGWYDGQQANGGDAIPACIRCITGKGEPVFCPKENKTIPSPKIDYAARIESWRQYHTGEKPDVNCAV